MYMYDSTSTEGHTCSAHMTILILSNMCVHVYMYDSTSTESHTSIAHTCTCMTTILIHVLSNICVYRYVHTCVYICMTLLVLRVIHVVHI